jgi:hypothetical protein
MIKHLSAAAVAVLAAGLVPLASAQAAVAPAGKSLPNPCKTFTVKSARTLLQVGSHTHLTEKLTSGRNPASRTCTIKHGKKRLEITVQSQAGGTGSEENCYSRPRLGSDGQVCVSVPHSPAFSLATFHKHGLWVADGLNAALPQKGKRIYEFALPQYRHFKG